MEEINKIIKEGEDLSNLGIYDFYVDRNHGEKIVCHISGDAIYTKTDVRSAIHGRISDPMTRVLNDSNIFVANKGFEGLYIARSVRPDSDLSYAEKEELRSRPFTTFQLECLQQIMNEFKEYSEIFMDLATENFQKNKGYIYVETSGNIFSNVDEPTIFLKLPGSLKSLEEIKKERPSSIDYEEFKYKLEDLVSNSKAKKM